MKRKTFVPQREATSPTPQVGAAKLTLARRWVSGVMHGPVNTKVSRIALAVFLITSAVAGIFFALSASRTSPQPFIFDPDPIDHFVLNAKEDSQLLAKNRDIALQAERLFAEAISERARLERAALDADRRVTEAYQLRSSLNASEFQSQLQAAKAISMAADNAATQARNVFKQRHQERDNTRRTMFEQKAHAAVSNYLRSAQRHVTERRRGAAFPLRRDDAPLRYGVNVVLTPGSETPARFLHVRRDVSVNDLKGLRPIDAAATCELMIIGVEACDHHVSTYLDCVLLYGTDVWDVVLQPQCGESGFWQTLTASLHKQFPHTSRKGVQSSLSLSEKKEQLLDFVVRAATWQAPPALDSAWGNVTQSPYAQPLQCTVRQVLFAPKHIMISEGTRVSEGVNATDRVVYPLSYGVTQQYFVSKVSRRKLFDWFPILPALKPLTSTPILPAGVSYRHAYSLGIEDEYLNALLLRFSKFAWTHIRGGPDSMRHYEILSQGTVPFFVDLEACQDKPCLSHLPHDLLLEARRLPGVDHIPTVNDSFSRVRSEYFYRVSQEDAKAVGRANMFTSVVNFVAVGDVKKATFDQRRYLDLADQLLQRAKATLSCASVVKSLLVRSGFDRLSELPQSILFISFPHTDYITYTIECGLAELGLNYTVNYRFGTAYVDQDNDMMRPIHRDAAASLNTVTGRRFIDSVLKRRTTKNYGNGFATAQKINEPPNPTPTSQEELCAAVRRGHFDLYIVSWKSRRFLTDSCFDDAVQTLGSNRVVIVDGEDIEYLPNFTAYTKEVGVKVFSREARCGLFS